MPRPVVGGAGALPRRNSSRTNDRAGARARAAARRARRSAGASRAGASGSRRRCRASRRRRPGGGRARGVHSRCASSFSSAEASALGRPVSVAATASAANSRAREMPSTDSRDVQPRTNVGGTPRRARTASALATHEPPGTITAPLRSTPASQRDSDRAQASRTRLGAEQISTTAASRLARCASSCASTASSSASSSSSSSFRVTWIRPPTVQAVAIRLCETTSFGAGRSARMHSRRRSSAAWAWVPA